MIRSCKPCLRGGAGNIIVFGCPDIGSLSSRSITDGGIVLAVEIYTAEYGPKDFRRYNMSLVGTDIPVCGRRACVLCPDG